MKTIRFLAAILAFVVSTFACAKTPIETETVFSQAELDQMLAPIALYPDTVLSHILIAATYPLEVVQAQRWVEQNSELSADEALVAAEVEDWDPSVTALVAFPDILNKMSAELDWTSNLGNAFLQDEERVLQRVQDLRSYAYKAGNLDSLDHLKVTKEKTTIIIEPAEPQVIYVPYYDTRVVYGDWWWPSHPPVYWTHRPYYRHSHHFYWAPSIHIGTSFYFSSVHWHNRYVVRVPHYRHHNYRIRSGRQVVRHRDSRRWEHDIRHRRGVEYRDRQLHTRYVGERDRSTRYSDVGRTERHQASAVGERLRRQVRVGEQRDQRDRYATRNDENRAERNNGAANLRTPSLNERTRSEPRLRDDRERAQRQSSARERVISTDDSGRKRYIADPQVDRRPRLEREPQPARRAESVEAPNYRAREATSFRSSSNAESERRSSRSFESRSQSNSRVSGGSQRNFRSSGGSRSESSRSRHHER